MSYKKAWAMVQRLNQFSEEALVILKKGGQHGGGAEVSLYGLEIMNEYNDLQLKARQLIVQEEKLLKVLK
jgi:molybdate transport system regulatory protein